MWTGVKTWIEARLPLGAIIRWVLEEDIPGGARFAYVFGSASLLMFLLLAVTGVLQLFYYVPTTDHAYDSLMYLRLQVPFGWLLHGMHYWSAQAFLVLVGLHLARVFIWGAYKNPRQMTWLVGVALLVLVAAMSFTGPLLAWDQLGYWSAEVGTSIAGTVPWIGAFLQRFFRGGETMGQETMSRFFVFHVALLPALLLAGILLHLIAFRQAGSVGPWNPLRREGMGKFWPDQVYRDILVSSFIVVVLVGLCVFPRAPITGVADPVGLAITPKPVWNFLFLYQALKVFKGPWETAGTVGLPIVLILILLLLPLYDRNARVNPRKRPIAMIGGLLLVLGVVTLTILGYYANPSAYGAKATADPDVNAPAASAPRDPPPRPAGDANRAAAPADNAAANKAAAGRALFRSQHCDACHKIDGQGGAVGPDLSNEADAGRSAAWLAAQIRDAKTHNPQSIMPAYTALSPEQVTELTDYLLTLRSEATKPAAQEPPSGQREPAREAARLIGDWREGRTLLAAYCSSCHGPEGTDKIPNPGSERGAVPALNPIAANLRDRDPAVFAARIDRFIQDGSVPSGPHPALRMPAYGNKKSLTQPQIAAVEAYILRLNGVDRAQILHPGMAPPQFFLLTVIAFAVVWVVVLILSHASKRTSASTRK